MHTHCSLFLGSHTKVEGVLRFLRTCPAGMCVQQEQDIYGGNEVMKPMHLSPKMVSSGAG